MHVTVLLAVSCVLRFSSAISERTAVVADSGRRLGTSTSLAARNRGHPRRWADSWRMWFKSHSPTYQITDRKLIPA